MKACVQTRIDAASLRAFAFAGNQYALRLGGATVKMAYQYNDVLRTLWSQMVGHELEGDMWARARLCHSDKAG